MRMLDCAKTIGLTMTDSCMMTPTKSVTAVDRCKPGKGEMSRSGVRGMREEGLRVQTMKDDSRKDRYMLRDRLGKELLYFDGGMGNSAPGERGLPPGNCRRPGMWNTRQ